MGGETEVGKQSKCFGGGREDSGKEKQDYVRKGRKEDVERKGKRKADVWDVVWGFGWSCREVME